MSIDITIQSADPTSEQPPDDAITTWIDAAANATDTTAGELTVRFVDAHEMRELNHKWRQKDSPTNVLSFEFDANEFMPITVLGDIVVCGSVVEDEAKRYEVPVRARYAHMIVHGFLHLVGFDHVEREDAQIMERHEASVLTALGFGDPWGDEVLAS